MSKILSELVRCGVDPEIVAEVAHLIASEQMLASQVAGLDRQRTMAAARQQAYRDRNVTATPRNVTPPSIEGKKVREKKVDRANRRRPLPDDFEPDRSYALEKGMDASKIEGEVERFKNHARANGRLQVDWQGAWRNWVTSPYQQHNGGRNGSGQTHRNGSREHRQERTANAIAALADYAGGGGRDDAAPPDRLPLPEPDRP